jgi:putative hydrolase of the HAD superfamily
MTFQAVFFDMGGTIETYWYTPEFRLQATPDLQELLRSAGIDLRLTDQQLYDVVSIGWDRYHAWSIQSLTELPPDRVWRDYIFTDHAVDPGRLASAAQDLMFFLETRFYYRQMRPEIPVVLETIKNMGLKIGIISNVNSRDQVPVNLSKYNLLHYFDPIVLSSVYGRRKPDPAIFHYAARLAHVPTSDCIYVGDRIARDILGARKAGFNLAIQINHDFEHGEEDDGATPDFVINQMTELLDILREKLDNLANAGQVCNKRPIHALLFDAGDILYFRPNRGARFEAFLRDLSLSPDMVPDDKVKALKERAYRGRIDENQYHEALLLLYGITQQELIDRGRQILVEENNNISFFEGVRETLITLKSRAFKLGIITDTAASIHTKLNWFEAGGFGHVWDTIISSKEINVQKPDPLIYHAALHQLGLRPDQAVFIGHDAKELDGARAVGMKTIAFNYEKTAQADFYIEKFADLLKVPVIA